MTIYPETRPDYYQKRFDAETYTYLLQELCQTQSNRYLSVTDRGLVLVGIIEYIWENFKGYLGFENSVLPEKVHAEWLKFLHYGLVEGFFQKEETLQSLHALKVSNPFVRGTIQVILGHAENKMGRVREQLTNYCRQNGRALEPAFWDRFFARTIRRPPTGEFGETYLALAQQGREEGVGVTERIQWLYRAASPKFSMSRDYSERLDGCYRSVEALQGTPWQEFRGVELEMGERKYLQKDPKAALVHLDKARKIQKELSPYHAYLEFISSVNQLSQCSTLDSIKGWKTTCLENCTLFFDNPPEFPENEHHLRADYANALVMLGDYHLDSSQSTGSRAKALFGFKGQQKERYEKALDCYTRALIFSEDTQEQGILGKLWDHLGKMRKLDIDLGKFRGVTSALALKETVLATAAEKSFVCLQSFPLRVNLTSSSEWVKMAERFAQSLAKLYKEGSQQKHLKLLDQAITLFKIPEENLYKFMEILCQHLCVDTLRNSREDIQQFRVNCYQLGRHYQKKKEWEKGAHRYLDYLKCLPPDGSTYWQDGCKELASCLSELMNENLLEQALLYHRNQGPAHLASFIAIVCARFESLPPANLRNIMEILCKNVGIEAIEQSISKLPNCKRAVSELAFEYFAKESWEQAAQRFLLCLKCFSKEGLALSKEGAKMTQFFAISIGRIFENKQLEQKHIELLDKAIEHRMVFTESNIDKFIQKNSFLVDQGACLYYLRGVIRESLLRRFSKDEISADFISACQIAPRHPWGAAGYFAEDDQGEADIDSYRSCILGWGGGTLHTKA